MAPSVRVSRSGLSATAALADVALVAVTFAPWLRSGVRVRSSYEVAAALDRLQVLDGWVRPAITVLWFFVPLLGAVCVLAMALGHRHAAAIGSTVLALAALAFALSIAGALNGTQWGVPATIVASIVVLVLAVATGLPSRTGRRAP